MKHPNVLTVAIFEKAHEWAEAGQQVAEIAVDVADVLAAAVHGHERSNSHEAAVERAVARHFGKSASAVIGEMSGTDRAAIQLGNKFFAAIIVKD